MKKSSLIQSLLDSEVDPAFSRRAKIILEAMNPLPEEIIVDIGCGRGFYLRALATLFPRNKIIGIDRNRHYLRIAAKFAPSSNISLIQADAQQLPFENSSVHWIVASEILEHLDNDLLALQEIHRILEPKGKAIISVPHKNYPFLWDPLNWLLERTLHFHLPSQIWWLAGIWADHKRLYQEEELIHKAKVVGLAIKKVWRTTHYCLPFAHFLFYGIGKNLVEKGVLKEFNRFSDLPNSKQKRQSLVFRSTLALIETIDRLNQESVSKEKTYLNLIMKLEKEVKLIA